MVLEGRGLDPEARAGLEMEELDLEGGPGPARKRREMQEELFEFLCALGLVGLAMTLLVWEVWGASAIATGTGVGLLFVKCWQV